MRCRVLVLAAAAACSQRLPSAPRLDAVEPPAAPLGVAVAVTIRGQFYLDAHLSFAGGASHVRDAFGATLGGVTLGDVVYVDASTLEATVPATLAAGVHDLRVIDPAGREGLLAGAFTVGTATGGDAGPDGGAIDGGTIDAGAIDGGTIDGGTIDGGAIDGGAIDAGAIDAGTTDAGTIDAGTIDGAASPDAASDVDAAPPSGGTPPLVSIVVTPAAGTTSTLFVGDATGTTDREGGPFTFDWDWDADGAFDASGPTATHSFAAAGTFVVAARATDPTGLAEWGTFPVVVAAASSVGTVTDPVDVDDGTTAPGPGFSLREALIWANATAGKQTILVPAGMVIALASALPAPNDGAGVDVIAYGAVLDGSALGGGAASCFSFQSPNNLLAGVEIRNCPTNPVSYYAGPGNRVKDAWIHHNAAPVEILSDGNTLGPGNRLEDGGARAVELFGTNVVTANVIRGHGIGVMTNNNADGAVVTGNVIADGGIGVFLVNGITGFTVTHNTFAFQTDDAFTVGGTSSAVDFRNNIVTGAGGRAVVGAPSHFAALDANLLFANAMGDCSACTHGPATVFADPLFVDAAARDLRLVSTSPAIDAGASLGGDVNGPAPGLFDGAAPDLGAWESDY